MLATEFASRLLERWVKRVKRRLVLQRLRLHGVPNPHSIPSYTHLDELVSLFELVRQHQLQRIIEVGSHLGKSSLFLACALPRGGTLYCIDTWQNDAMPGGTADVFEAFCKNTMPLKDRIVVVRANTRSLTEADVPSPIDMVFIDADHSYRSVKRDIQLFAHHVRKGGFLAFHDFGSWAGVTRGVAELLQTLEWSPVSLTRSLFVLTRAVIEGDEEKWRRLQCEKPRFGDGE